MEQDETQDVSMSDGEVIRSTESHPSLLTQSAGDNITGKQALGTYDGTGPLPRPHYSDATLKGKGTIRQTVTQDHQLVARKDGPKPAKFANLPYGTLQTGLVYDVRMRFHVEAEPPEDDLHPEDPRRIHAIFEAFVEAGLAWRDGTSGPANDYYMGRIDARMVTREEVCLVSSPNLSLSSSPLRQQAHRQRPADKLAFAEILANPLTAGAHPESLALGPISQRARNRRPRERTTASATLE